MRLPNAVASLLLAGQLIGIARMPFVDDRYFAWSPHDQRTDFTVEATHQGRPVTPREIHQRYRLLPTEWHATGDVFAVIRTAEARAPGGDRWQVTVRYRVNLAEEQTWTWPTNSR